MPTIALGLVGLKLAHFESPILIPAFACAIVAAVLASVHHAEVIAHRVGEPLGTLVLAVAVTVIEVALIVSVMLAGDGKGASLARDTVFAAVMIVCNGIVGLCLLVGSLRHRVQEFQTQGVAGALAALAALTVLSLVLPNFTIGAPGPAFTTSQLVFAGLMSLVLYGVFVFCQTVRHSEDFLVRLPGIDDADAHRTPAHVGASCALLIVSLVAVVGLAKALAPTVEAAVTRAGAPETVVGLVIATLVLLPEGLAAVRAASSNRIQTSLNLALGSALASIGLTIPTVAIVSICFDLPLTLGLGSKEEVLLALTLVVNILTLGTGRITLLQGPIHLVVASAFLFLAVVP